MSAELPFQPRPVISDADKARAREFFGRADQAAETRNYDYAIELYLFGLALWPEAVDEGLKKLRVVGTARRQAGAKPPGFLQARKYPTTGRDPRKNLQNALHLFALDPANSVYLEAVLVSSVRCGFHGLAHWVAPILWDAFSADKKPTAARCAAIITALDQAGEHFQNAGDLKSAGDLFHVAQLFGDVWKRLEPNSAEAARALGHASSKLTIVRGRFGTDEDFRGSLKDAAAQRDLHDQQRVVQPAERTRELIDKARAEHHARPDDAARLLAFVDLLTRQEDPDDENEALAALDAAWKRTSTYTFKLRADDLRMRRLRRELREAIARADAAPDDPALRRAADDLRRRQLEFEADVFEAHARHYPTDMRFRFELAHRLFELRRFDEAIPAFQQAQNEPRRRLASRLFIGRCFFEKNFLPQAVSTLAAALAEHPIPDDDLGKELRYWLGRAHEAAGRSQEAAAAYGELIQFDYNYRDARGRLEQLSAPGGPSS